MKNFVFAFALSIMLCSCSKITQERVLGTWTVEEIKEIPTDVNHIWTKWLDTTEVKVSFLGDGTVKVFYFENDTVVGYSSGTYLLKEEEEQIVIDDTSRLFNSHGQPLDVTLLRKNKMMIEGKYFLNAIDSTLPSDSYTKLEWTFEN